MQRYRPIAGAWGNNNGAIAFRGDCYCLKRGVDNLPHWRMSLTAAAPQERGEDDIYSALATAWRCRSTCLPYLARVLDMVSQLWLASDAVKRRRADHPSRSTVPRKKPRSEDRGRCCR